MTANNFTTQNNMQGQSYHKQPWHLYSTPLKFTAKPLTMCVHTYTWQLMPNSMPCESTFADT